MSVLLKEDGAALLKEDGGHLLSGIATAGIYEFRCVATRTADSKTRTFRGQIRLLAQAT